MKKFRNLLVAGAALGTIVIVLVSCEPKKERLMPGMGRNACLAKLVGDNHMVSDTADFSDHATDSIPDQQTDTVPCDCDTVVEQKTPCCGTVIYVNNGGVVSIGDNNTINQNQAIVNTNGNNNQTTVNGAAGNGNRSNSHPQPRTQRRRNNQTPTQPNQEPQQPQQPQQTEPCPCETVVEEECHTQIHISVRGSATVTQQPAQQSQSGISTYYYNQSINLGR